MPDTYTEDYLLDKQVKIFQPTDGYRASSDAVLLSAMVNPVRKGAKILDVGSGTGAISLCLAQRLQNHGVTIDGLELQEELVKLANMSADANKFDFVHFHSADIRQKFNIENVAHGSFDIVVSNPPYSENDMPSPNVSKATAHNHHDFGLAQWLEFCLKMLKSYGRIFLVHRAEALPQICSILQNKTGAITILPLYSKNGQIAKRVIISAQKDAKTPGRILPPFVTHNDDGKYTPQAEEILRKGLTFEDIFST